MKILCKLPGAPQHESYDFLRISLKDTPAEGYEPMAGGEVVRIGHLNLPAMGASRVSHA